MTHSLPTTFPEPAISVDIPPGAGRAYYAARIAAVLSGERARKPHTQHRPTLASLLKQAAKAGKSVKGAEVYRDRTVLQFGEPEAAEPENPWPLDEFRNKETKQ